MVFLTIVFVIQIGVSSVLLKAACWLYNYFFASSDLLTRVTANTASSVTTETAGRDGASENEQTNPFATPRQIAEPIAKNHERPIVVPTLGLSISIGLLTGMLLFVFGFGLLGLLLVGCDVFWVIIAAGLALVMTFIVTAAFVSDSLTDNFKLRSNRDWHLFRTPVRHGVATDRFAASFIGRRRGDDAATR